MLKRVTNLRGMLLLLLMFLVAMEFFSLQYYIIYAAFLLLVVGRKRIWIDGVGFLYFLFSIVIGVHDSFVSILSIIRPLSFTMCYMIGLNFVGGMRSDQMEETIPVSAMEEKIMTAVKVVVYGMFTHYVLNFIYNLGSVFFRNSDDIWTGMTRAATGQAMLAALMTAVCSHQLICGTKRKRIVAVIHLVILMAYNLMLGGRTLPVMLAVFLIVGLVYLSRYPMQKSESIKPFLRVLLVITLFAILFVFNVFGIRKAIMNSALMERFTVRGGDATYTGRITNKINYIKDLYLSPLGGSGALYKRYGFAHDLLLDSFDQYGIIPFVLLIMILYYTVKRLKEIYSMVCYSVRFRLFIILVYLCMAFSFLVEPILSGAPFIFIAFCFINGLISGLLKMNDEKPIIDYVDCFEEEPYPESELP